MQAAVKAVSGRLIASHERHSGAVEESGDGSAPLEAAREARAPRAIRILLSAASLLFLLLMIGLGVFSMQRLSDVNRVSDEIRNQWLQDIRLIGDLNNYMSDYRTGEGTHLLSNTAAELAASEKEIAELDWRVTHAQRSYEALPHENAEQRSCTISSPGNGRHTRP